MKDLRNLHALRVGTHPYGHGPDDYVEIVPEVIRSLAQSYSPKLLRSPVVLGHPTTTGLPAYGWIVSARSENDNDLYLDTKITDELANMLNEGSYGNVSLSYYEPDSALNPKPGSYYIRHIGMLGAEPPAVKGLNVIELSVRFMEDEVTPTPVDEVPSASLDIQAEDLIRKAITESDDTIIVDVFDPPLTEENAWSYDNDKMQFAGSFADNSGGNHTYVVAKSGDAWVASIDVPVEEVPSTEILSEEQPKLTTLDDLLDLVKSKQPETEKIESTTTNDLSEALYNQGFLIEAQVPKEKIDGLFKNLSVDQAKEVIDLITSRRKQIEFSELANTSVPDNKPEPVRINLPNGSQLDKQSAKVHSLAIKHCKDNKLDHKNPKHYLDAVKFVQQEA